MHYDLFTIGGLTIYSYGIMIALGIMVAVAVAIFRSKRKGLNSDIVLNITLLCAFLGFVGAKILYVIIEFPAFQENPWEVFSGSGFVVYGGIISGVLAAILLCKKKKYDFYSYLDLLIPSVAMAQGFGRIGCFLAGCCYGRPTADWWGVTFPEGSIAPAGIPLIPTQLISAAGNFLLATILIIYSRKAKNKGNVGAAYLVLNGIGRFLIEFLRNDDRGGVGFLSTSQLISLFIMAGGLALFWFNNRREKTLRPAPRRRTRQ